MFPSRANHLRLLLSSVVLAAACTAAPLCAQPEPEDEALTVDPVAAYLESHGLTDLVAARLEAQLRETLGEERVPLAAKLALLYGRLLDESDSEEDRSRWERSSRALLERVPQADTETLRLTIHKATYLRAERTAELYRLRAVDEAARRDAIRLMGEVASVLGERHLDIQSRLRRLEMTDVTSDASAAAIERQLAELGLIATQTAYFGAWAHYYHDWLADTTDGLDTAIAMFSTILQIDPQNAMPDDIAQDFLGFEHAARSVLGIALCHAQAGRTSIALDWFAVVNENQGTHKQVRLLLPGYELHLLAQARQWDRLRETVEGLKYVDRFTLSLARLTAVLAMTGAQQTGDPEARQISELAINELAQRGAMDQVADISEVFDLQGFGSDNFTVSYVLATKAYEKAREAHGNDEPTDDPEVLALYEEAHQQLSRTITRRDAGRWTEALRQARLLDAMTMFYRGEFVPAARAFASLAGQASDKQAEEALWMAVVCRDRYASLEPDDPNRARAFQAAIEDYLSRFGASHRAGTLRLRRVTTIDDLDPREGIDELLAIPPESEAYEKARREAERMLYAQVRAAQPSQRMALVREYLELALRLLDNDQRRILTARSDQAQTEQYLFLMRRVLDVLLMQGVARIDEARQILDRLETARTAGLINLDGIEAEIEYRRFEIALLSGSVEQAEQLSKAIRDSDAQSPYANAASRSLYSYAVQDWRAYPDHPQLERTLRRVIEHGRASLNAPQSVPDLKQSGNVIIALNVAEAALALHQRSNDSQSLALAREWFNALHQAEDRSFRVLRGWATLNEIDGNLDDATENWRIAMSGSRQSDDTWFEAKFHFLRLLSQSDKARAAEVLKQHVLLYPDFGPTPWGEKLKSLADTLGVSSGGGP